MSTELKRMHMGQITSFFIPNVTLVGEGCSKEIPDRLKNIGGVKPLLPTQALSTPAYSSRSPTSLMLQK